MKECYPLVSVPKTLDKSLKMISLKWTSKDLEDLSMLLDNIEDSCGDLNLKNKFSLMPFGTKFLNSLTSVREFFMLLTESTCPTRNKLTKLPKSEKEDPRMKKIS